MTKTACIELIGDVIAKIDTLRGDLSPNDERRKKLDKIREKLRSKQREIAKRVFNENTEEYKIATSKLTAVNRDVQQSISDLSKVVKTFAALASLVTSIDELLGLAVKVTRAFDDGVGVTLPVDFELAKTRQPGKKHRGKARFSGVVPLASSSDEKENEDMILSALRKNDINLLREIDIAPSSEAMQKRRTVRSSADLIVELKDNEEALLLLEQDGMYLWKRPSESQPHKGKRLRGKSSVTTQKRAIFHIDLDFNPRTDRPVKKRDFSGVLRKTFPGKIKAFLFKFIINKAVGVTVKFMERNLKKGFVHINSTNSSRWKECYNLSDLKLPEDRSPRILLLIHGTFVNTISSFGSIPETPWGKEFFDAALKYYDAILGFNHPTLSENPLQNAQEMLDDLKNVKWRTLPVFDIITHSRGGLVVRSFIEKLLPKTNWKPKINRVIFVACTNKGTLLAEPENWEDLINLYTNLIIGTGRVIGALAPTTKAVAAIVGNAIENIADFLKYFADSTITQGNVPGLSAMEPDGKFVKNINKFQKGQPTVEESYYCAITSEFKPKLTGDHKPKELPVRFFHYIAGSMTKKLMLEANDLVVHTSSMKAIDQTHGDYIRESLDFGENPEVHHTNYFIRPEVTDILARWLRLPAPGKEGRSISKSITKLLRPDVDIDILVANATSTAGALREEIAERSPSYVVVRKLEKEKILNYAFRAEEALEMIGRKKILPVDDVLLSFPQDVKHSLRGAKTFAAGTKESEIVMAGNIPVGIKPKKVELPDSAELLRRAKIISKPANDREKIIRSRTMPVFVDEMTMEWDVSPEKLKPLQEVTAYVRAEMDAEVIIKRATTVCVTISREMLEESVTGGLEEAGKGKFDKEEQILIQILPKSNFTIIDSESGRAEIDIPEPGEPMEMLFDLRATEEGEGEIWVVARQGQIPIIKLVLKPAVVKKRTLSSKKTHAGQAATEPPTLKKPLHQLTIVERKNDDGFFYEYEIYSPSIRFRDSSKPLKGDRNAYVQNLYDTIEERWISSQGDKDNFLQELRAFGTELFNKLIPEKLQEKLWKFRKDFDSVQIVSTEPFIPWELIHLKNPAKKGMPEEEWFLGQMGVVRWLYGAGENGWPPETISVREGYARYVIPEYPDSRYELPEAEKEADFLKNKLHAKMLNAESGEVRKLISMPGSFDLLHFACHGTADQNNIGSSKLLMEGRIESSGYVLDGFTETVASEFSNLVDENNNRPVIVVNACQTGRSGYKLTGLGGFANAFLLGGAGAFIGALWSVGDAPARTFIEALYCELLNGSNLSKATIKARQAAKDNGDATWLAYVVYGHPYLELKMLP